MITKVRRYSLVHYLFGALPARLGDEMSSQAILLLGLGASASAGVDSTLLAALTLSAAPGGPLLGAVLNRAARPGNILAGALALYAAGLGLITLLVGHAPLALPLGVALLAGFFMPAISGGWSSRLKSFIADEHMTRASAIDATTFNIAGLAGPAMAGLIAAAYGVHWAMIALIGLLVMALPMAWSLPARPAAARDSAPEQLSSFWHDVGGGFKAIVAKRPLLRITLMSVVSYFGIGLLWVACPLVGKHLFGNAGYGGVLMSALSVGALAATAAYAKWPSRRSPEVIALWTTIILAAAMLILAFAHNKPTALAAMFLAGVADGPQLAAIFAVRHREAPERARSQVFTTGASLKITAAAIGSALAGQIAGHSLRATILAAAGVQILAAASFTLCAKS